MMDGRQNNLRWNRCKVVSKVTLDTGFDKSFATFVFKQIIEVYLLCSLPLGATIINQLE